MRKVPLIASMTFVAAVALTACGGPTSSTAKIGETFDEIVELAGEEGSLTLYTSTADSQVQNFTAAFTEEYGVEVEVLRLSVSELEQRFSSEADSQNIVADVLSVSSPRIYETSPEWFVDMSTVENYGAYPDGAKAPESVTIMLYPYVLTYNTDLVAPDDVPTSWEDAVDPKWEGEAILTDPRSSPAYMGWADAMQRSLGDDFLIALGELKPSLVESATPGAQQLAAGEGYLSFPSLPVHPQPLIESGAPLDYVYFENPPAHFAQNLGVAAGGPNPNAARLFAAWSMSEAGANAFCIGGLISSPVLLDDPSSECLPLPADWELVNPVVGDDQQNHILDLLQIDG